MWARERPARAAAPRTPPHERGARAYIIDLCGAFDDAFQVRQYLLRVSFGLYFVEDVLDLPIRADDESGARHSHHLLPVHVFLLDHVIGATHFLLGIAQQRERQAVLFLEFLLRFRRIRRDTQQHGAGILHLSIGIAELAGLDGAARSIGAGIEK